MVEAIQHVKTARYKLHAVERVGNRVLTADSEIKLNVSPRKLYFKNHKGIEVLYVEGQHEGNALVFPNSFPFVTLQLNPLKSIMRSNQHHSIFDLGFEQIGKVIKNTSDRHLAQHDKVFFLLDDVVHHGRVCYKIYSDIQDFRYIQYTVRKGETVRSIADKFAIGEFRIHLKNPNLHLTDPIKEGKVLTIPNYYADKTILYVDKELMLPVYIKVFDDEGLYEYYDFSELVINQAFQPLEFSRKYPGYRL
jgi:hypothetical protein